MSIKLFEHNQTAFDDALEMLEETGKAAVVHPTGTGKSYIGFKLCEQFPDKTICWLSPSEYIYKTQLENLKEDSDGWQPENVKFFTYAKLMLMTEVELQDIQPDYIILDEFHRCGAEMWGDGVNHLLEMYPDVPILGLTATAIRYLDNQRNMVDELFDGNIASEMTLGEAIVRGILNPPKYVLSVFAYQEDYDKLKLRVSRSKNKAVKDKAEQYLESLRRALEMADGMDVIFDKHITDRIGKYIVFCSNIDHLREMQSNVASWFSKIDKEPHIYTAYSLDSSTEQEFDDFKKDESEHLKLLFCIDMLNEGVHVENISGVILFRPTVSPIIYKQQIGRALSASKTKNPIIFDIVNNIENLASIDTIQKEMQIAISYYRERGESNDVINEHFQVIDEVRDAKELFNNLNDCLTASWDMMFESAKRYFKTYGNLNVPRAYKTPEGYSLGSWIGTQRAVYRGEKNGLLTDDRIKKLEAIGMRWDSAKDIAFERYLSALKKFKAEYGHLKVPHSYITDDGIRLGDVVVRIRAYRKNGSNSCYITPERIKQLDSLGMIWNVSDNTWIRNMEVLREYYANHGNLNLPYDYSTEDGVNISKWLRGIKTIYRNQSKRHTLDKELVKALEDMKIEWRTDFEIKWQRGYRNLCMFYEKNKTCDVPKNYVSEDGQKLSTWVQNQKTNFHNGKLSQEHVELLNKINFSWELRTPETTWEKNFAIAQAYYAEHGDLEIKRRDEYKGISLAHWLQEQRRLRKGKVEGATLTTDQIRRLDSIGMRWDDKKELIWKMRLEEARRFFELHGAKRSSETSADSSEKAVYIWLRNQRKKLRAGKLSEEQVKLLRGLDGYSVTDALAMGKAST